MEGLKQYLIAVTATASICGIAKIIADEKTVAGSMIRRIGGLIMTITVLSPVLELNLGELPELTSGLVSEAKEAAAL